MENRKEFIEILTKYNKKSECDCESCKGMCKRVPCIGTPRDILNIMEKKGIDFVRENFSLTHYTPLTMLGYADNMTKMIASNCREDGSCVFFNKDGLCDIHDIKPTEGIYTSCHDHAVNPVVDASVLTAMEWSIDRDMAMEAFFKFTGDGIMALKWSYENAAIKFKIGDNEFCALDKKV